MIKAGSISKGIYLLLKNEPYQVTGREFVNPGKGVAFVRLKLKNVINGSVLKQVLKSQESVEEINVENKQSQYLYSDGDSYIFMDTESFEQFGLSIEAHKESGLFMKEGDTVEISFWDDRALNVQLPYKIVLTVTEAEKALKGDTVSGANKLVTLETGLRIKVPLFIKTGDKVLVNTETREYVERAN